MESYQKSALLEDHRSQEALADIPIHWVQVAAERYSTIDLTGSNRPGQGKDVIRAVDFRDELIRAAVPGFIAVFRQVLENRLL